MERGGQFKAKLNDLILPHMDERSDDFDVCVAGPGRDEPLKSFVIGGTTIWIAGTVLFDGPDEHFFRSQHLGPAYGRGEKVSVAERNVGDGDGFADRLVFR